MFGSVIPWSVWIIPEEEGREGVMQEGMRGGGEGRSYAGRNERWMSGVVMFYSFMLVSDLQ